jgi:ORF6N domain
VNGARGTRDIEGKVNDLKLAKIERRIFLVRSQKVMLDFDLAELYGVETRALKQVVRRNYERFPPDFMFELSATEIKKLVSQTVIPTRGKLGGAIPMAFTEQGVAMLSSVLRSSRAVQVNIAIMRTFVRLREMLLSNADLARKLAALAAPLNAAAPWSRFTGSKLYRGTLSTKRIGLGRCLGSNSTAGRGLLGREAGHRNRHFGSRRRTFGEKRALRALTSAFSLLRNRRNRQPRLACVNWAFHPSTA